MTCNRLVVPRHEFLLHSQFTAKAAGEFAKPVSSSGSPPGGNRAGRAGVAGIYDRATYAREMREALERWAHHLEAITK